MATWLGLDNLTGILAGYLLDNGFDAADITLLSNGSLTLPRVWVSAVVNGVTCVFDPAFKSYQEHQPLLSVTQASGYDRTALVAAVSRGATVTDSQVRNLDGDGLTLKLGEYAGNLITAMRDQHPNRELKELIGGRTLVPTTLAGLPTSLSFPVRDTTTWDDIPLDRTAVITIDHRGLSYSAPIPEIAGRRLTLTYRTDNGKPELRLDGTLAASGDSTSQGAYYPLTVTVDHPYAYSERGWKRTRPSASA
jgi:hypothetical protein